MKFTIGTLLLVTLTVAVLLACGFILPAGIGALILTFISLFVLPPFIWVGAINLRGTQQAFFLGAIVSGIPHFVYSAYAAITYVIYRSEGLSYILDPEFPRDYCYIHLIGILLGCFGGFWGTVSHQFLIRRSDKKDEG